MGIMLLMAESYRTGLVWKVFMDAPEVQLGMQLAGFRSEATALQIPLAAED